MWKSLRSSTQSKLFRVCCKERKSESAMPCYRSLFAFVQVGYLVILILVLKSIWFVQDVMKENKRVCFQFVKWKNWSSAPRNCWHLNDCPEEILNEQWLHATDLSFLSYGKFLKIYSPSQISLSGIKENTEGQCATRHKPNTSELSAWYNEKAFYLTRG